MTENKEQERAEITALPGVKKPTQNRGTTNNLVYLITVEDPFPKKKFRCFVCVKFDEKQHGVSFRGAEISATQKDQIKKASAYEDAIELANKNNSSIVELDYPWQRVVSIQNMAYVTKV